MSQWGNGAMDNVGVSHVIPLAAGVDYADLHFIGTFDHYISPEGRPDSAFFMEDMLHLNRRGYRQWSEIIKSSLREAGIEP